MKALKIIALTLLLGVASIALGQGIDVRTFGAKCDGTTDDSVAFQAAISKAQKVIVRATSASTVCIIGTPITAVSGMWLQGEGRPTLKASTNGKHIISGVSLSDVTIAGIKFEGTSSSTTPSTAFTGGAATDTGLVTINLSTDVRIYDNEFYNFYNGFTAIRSTRVWVERNRIRSWQLFGIQVAEAQQFTIDHNTIVGTAATGATESYGVHATGDSTNAHPSTANSISFNVIQDVPGWDAIMTHEVDGLRIIGNDIRNVRNGIDVGASGATPDLKNVIVANNYIKSTTTDPYATAPAHHSGIIISGKNSTYLIRGVTVTGNIIDGFFNVVGLVTSGDSGHIVVSYAEKAVVSGNSIINGGNTPNTPGILISGDTLSTVAITGNSLQGIFASGAIRLSAVIATAVSITGNAIKDGTTANIGIFISGSTLTALGVAGNSMNNNAGSQWSIGTTTVAFKSVDIFYSGSAVYDPPNLADGAGATTTVTVTGAINGDFAEASFSNDLQGITVTAWISAANTCSARFQNESGGALDLASGTLRCRSRPRDL